MTSQMKSSFEIVFKNLKELVADVVSLRILHGTIFRVHAMIETDASDAGTKEVLPVGARRNENRDLY